MRNGLRLSLGLVCLMLPAGCHSPNHPSDSPPDPVSQLALSCPSNVQVPNVKTTTQNVDFTTPSHTGGVEPVSVTCSPASGAAFPLGPTTVNCDGTDAASPPRTAACSFIVTLAPNPTPPVLGATNFMAFGDSITAGEINEDDGSCDPGPAFVPRARPQELMQDLSYPTLLQKLLSARYTNQSISVSNEGLSLSPAADTARFGAAYRAHQPDAVLLLQGIIDYDNPGDTPGLIESLTTDIDYAKANGVKAFFLSTLLPLGVGDRACGRVNVDIRAVNDEIRKLAAQEGVYLVDSYTAFKDQMSTLMGSDGLHPTAAGYEVLAQTFFEVIRFRLEQAPTTAAPSLMSPLSLPRPSVQIRSPAKR